MWVLKAECSQDLWIWSLGKKKLWLLSSRNLKSSYFGHFKVIHPKSSQDYFSSIPVAWYYHTLWIKSSRQLIILIKFQGPRVQIKLLKYQHSQTDHICCKHSSPTPLQLRKWLYENFSSLKCEIWGKIKLKQIKTSFYTLACSQTTEASISQSDLEPESLLSPHLLNEQNWGNRQTNSSHLLKHFDSSCLCAQLSIQMPLDTPP